LESDRERNFLKLVRANEARVHCICRVYARDADERDDLRQEILLQLWRSLPSFAGASAPATWLYRVALNTALTFSRRRSRRRETPLDEDTLNAARAADAPELPARLESAEQHEQLWAAVNRLGSVDKMLVTMYLDDRSYREMAEVLGVSENVVGVKLHRIRKALAAKLAQENV
jgi:RNA polymerase sigma-70 factor (ECF subfamily)